MIYLYMTKKTYKPGRPYVINRLQPGDVCNIQRYPFYWITGDKFSDFSVDTVSKAISNFETTIYDVSEDTLTFLKKVNVEVGSSVWVFCKFLVDEQIVYVSEDVLVDSTVTVLI